MFTTSPSYAPGISKCFEWLIIKGILNEGVEVGLGLDVPENKYLECPCKTGYFANSKFAN